jgi:hypothetical protein
LPLLRLLLAIILKDWISPGNAHIKFRCIPSRWLHGWTFHESLGRLHVERSTQSGICPCPIAYSLTDSIVHRIYTAIRLALKNPEYSIPIRRRLLHETITYEETREREVSILHELQYQSQRNPFFQYVRQRRHLVKELVAHRLGLSSSVCHATD